MQTFGADACHGRGAPAIVFSGAPNLRISTSLRGKTNLRGDKSATRYTIPRHRYKTKSLQHNELRRVKTFPTKKALPLSSRAPASEETNVDLLTSITVGLPKQAEQLELGVHLNCRVKSCKIHAPHGDTRTAARYSVKSLVSYHQSFFSLRMGPKRGNWQAFDGTTSITAYLCGHILWQILSLS